MSTVDIGVLGEIQVYNSLSADISLGLKILRNFPIVNAVGDGYFQSDIVIVCNRGIFSIEVKTWACAVVCSTKHYWEVQYPQRAIFVPSPIDQNNIHCRRLAEIIGEPVASVVVFSDNTRIMNPLSNVIHSSDLLDYIRARPIVYTSECLVKLYDFLAKYKEEHEDDMFIDFLSKQLKRVNK